MQVSGKQSRRKCTNNRTYRTERFASESKQPVQTAAVSVTLAKQRQKQRVITKTSAPRAVEKGGTERENTVKLYRSAERPGRESFSQSKRRKTGTKQLHRTSLEKLSPLKDRCFSSLCLSDSLTRLSSGSRRKFHERALIGSDGRLVILFPKTVKFVQTYTKVGECVKDCLIHTAMDE